MSVVNYLKAATEGIKEFISSKSNDIAAYSGGAGGYFIGDNTDPAFDLCNVVMTTSQLNSSFWTIFNMGVGAIVVFFAKKLAEKIWEKLNKKEK